MAFWSHNDSVAYNPCSFYSTIIDHGIPPDQAWFGNGHRKVIHLVEQGEPVPGCHRCYAEESLGRTSRRQASQDNYENFLESPDIEHASVGPEGLDYSVGNLCNLKCIVCGPDNSSSWISDYQKIYPDQDVSKYVFRKTRTVEIQDDRFLSRLRSVHFHGGGEPLMSDAHTRLLQRIKSVKGLSDVRVYYNTNGTQQVDQQTLDLWSQCKLVELYFSIDDVGHRFEYQRTGAKWQQVQDNIAWFKANMPHNHMFNVNCVWGYLNIFYLDELLDWHQENFNTNRYGDPCRLLWQKAIGPFSIDHLSSRAVTMLREKFKGKQPLLDLLQGIKISDQPHDKFWESIGRIDKVRNVDFKEICPEWSTWL